MKAARKAVLIFLTLFFAGSSWSQSAEETAARAAEQAGRLREALTQYTAALQKTAEGSGDEQRLREATVNLAQKISPAPAIPEEARRFLVRGSVAIKEAKTAADFEDAAKEFGRAARAAPWWADAYFNQGVAYERAGKFADAVRSLKLYLSFAPNAVDAAKVREQIYAIEYRQEKLQKEAAAAAQDQQRRRAEEEARTRDPARLAGEWCSLVDGEARCGDLFIRVTGGNIEITGKGDPRLVGGVQGDTITGNMYFAGLANIIGCQTISAPLRKGNVTSAGNRIELQYSQPILFGSTRATKCDIANTRPVTCVLVRKPSF